MVAPVSHKSLPSLVVLRNLLGRFKISSTRLSLSLVNDSALFDYLKPCHIEVLQPRLCEAQTVWAVPLSLVATDGISVDFFSSGYLDISVGRLTPTRYARNSNFQIPIYNEIPIY